MPREVWSAGQFDSNHVMAMAGISKRQIQWWDERGVVRPIQRAHKRHYTPLQATLVIVLAELLKKGHTLQRCRKLRPAILREIVAAAKASKVTLPLKCGHQITGNGPGRAWLATDGRRVQWIDSLDSLVEFSRDLPVTVVYLTPSLRMVGL